jgi:hypothetical protein
MAIDKNNETAEVTEAELDSEKFDLKQLPEIKLLLEAAKKTGTLDNSEMEKVVEKLEMEPEDIELIYALLFLFRIWTFKLMKMISNCLMKRSIKLKKKTRRRLSWPTL